MTVTVTVTMTMTMTVVVAVITIIAVTHKGPITPNELPPLKPQPKLPPNAVGPHDDRDPARK